MKCTIIPSVRNREGVSVQSELFQNLSQIFKDREATKRQYFTVKTETFKNWFGDSIYTDQNGEPMIVYQDNRFGYINENGDFKMVFNPEEVSDSNSLVPIRFDSGVQTDNKNYINFKRGLQSKLWNRLNMIDNMLAKPIDTDTAVALEQAKKRIKIRLNGDMSRGIIGLKAEIELLENMSNFRATNALAQQDLARMKSLMYSKDYNDLQEAESIARFYQACRSTSLNNPIFLTDEIFDSVGNTKLSPSEVQMVDSWADQASKALVNIEATKKEKLMETINSNISVKNTFGRKLTFEELFETSLEDITTVDKLFMDITNGIFSSNGPVTGIIKVMLDEAVDEAYSVTIGYEERINELVPKVTKIIEELEGGKYKLGRFIIGVKGVSWDLFYQRDIDGARTGQLVQRYSKKWTDTENKMLNKYERSLIQALENAQSAYHENNIYNRLIKDKHKFYKANSVIVDFTAIPEIVDFIQNELNFPKLEANMATGNTSPPTVSGNHLKEVIEKQKKLLKQFKNEYNALVQLAIDDAGVLIYDDLPLDVKADIEVWFHRNNPVNAINSMDKNPVTVMYGGRNEFVFGDTKFTVAVPLEEIKGVNTGFYDNNFEIIDQHQPLYDFHDVAGKVITYHKNVLPAEDQENILDLSIGGIEKSFADILFDRDMSMMMRINKSYSKLVQKVKMFGKIKEKPVVTSESRDPVTGRVKLEINKKELSFRQAEVNRIFTLNKAKFMEAYNNDTAPIKITRLNKYTTVSENSISSKPEVLRVLGEILEVPATMQDIKDALGIVNAIHTINKTKIAAKIPIGKILYNHATNKVVSDSSNNLPKTLMYFSQVAAMYHARSQVRPLLDTAVEYYKNINKPHVQNTGKEVRNRRDDKTSNTGKRENAIQQMDSWYTRGIIGDYATQKHWLIGKKKYFTKEQQKFMDEIEPQILALKEKENDLTITEVEKEILKDLEASKPEGYDAAASQALQDLLYAIRLKFLGWNLGSALTNFVEGQIANEIAASMELYYPAAVWYKAARITRSARKKALTRKGSETANFVSFYMNRYTVLQDSRNEFQKAGIKTNFSLTEKLDPMLITQAVEYLNQSPLLVSAMMSEKIEDNNGNISTLYDAMDKKTKRLKPEFRTEKNINNWEKMLGPEYHAFKSKLTKAIVNTHGDYEKLRGSMIKTTPQGKAMMIMKGWFPRQLYLRWATEQVDVEAQHKSFKGRYRSHTAATGGIQGFLTGINMLGTVNIGLALFGVGFSVPFSAAFLTYAGGAALFKRLGGRNPEMNVFKQTGIALWIISRKAIGIPVNRLTNRFFSEPLINTGSVQELEKYGFKTGNMTQQDLQNLAGNFTDMAIQMLLMLMGFIVKATLFDEDDEDDETRRRLHNVLMSRILKVLDQATSYTDPTTLGGIIQTPLFTAFAKDVFDLGDDLQKFMSGEDINMSTTDKRGSSNFQRALGQFFLPTTLWGGMLPFVRESKTNPDRFSPFSAGLNTYFYTLYKRTDEQIMRERARIKSNLEDSEKYTDEEIKEIMSKMYPTLLQQLKLAKKNPALLQELRKTGNPVIIKEKDIKRLVEEKAKKDARKIERANRKAQEIIDERLKNPNWVEELPKLE